MFSWNNYFSINFIILSEFDERLPIKTKPLILFIALTFLFSLSGSFIVFADNYKDGVNAYGTKDYKTAYKIFLPLAEKGNASAQFNLGQIYYFGWGTPQNYKKAIKWYRLAAEQENDWAQDALGGMYYKGSGMPQDCNEAIKWLKLVPQSRALPKQK